MPLQFIHLFKPYLRQSSNHLPNSKNKELANCSLGAKACLSSERHDFCCLCKHVDPGDGDWGIQKWDLVAFLSKFLFTLIFEVGSLIGTLVCLDYLVTDPRDSLVSCLSCAGTTGKGCHTWFMRGLW